ncbi:hypothetical protein GIB67_016189, partial [Kingdonia uniflora]
VFSLKLFDFGLTKAGPTGDITHVSTQVMDTQRYATPELLPQVQIRRIVLIGINLSREVIPVFARILLRTSLGKKHLVRTLLRTEITQVVNRRSWYDTTKLATEDVVTKGARKVLDGPRAFEESASPYITCSRSRTGIEGWQTRTSAKEKKLTAKAVSGKECKTGLRCQRIMRTCTREWRHWYYITRVALAKVSYQISRLHMLGHKNKDCQVLMMILTRTFDSDKYRDEAKVRKYEGKGCIGLEHGCASRRWTEPRPARGEWPPVVKRQKTVATGLIDEEQDELRGKEREPLSQSYIEEGTRSVGNGKLFAGSLPEGKVQSTPYKDKEKIYVAEALNDPRAWRTLVVTAVRCTLTLEAALLCSENLVSHNVNLEHRLEEMQAMQNELVKRAMQHELVEHLANVTAGLEEHLRIANEEKAFVEGDLEATHGRQQMLMLEKEAGEQTLREQLIGEKLVLDGLQG